MFKHRNNKFELGSTIGVGTTLLVMMAFAPRSNAANLYFDNNTGATGGFGGGGTINFTDTKWNPNSNGIGTLQTFTPATSDAFINLGSSTTVNTGTRTINSLTSTTSSLTFLSGGTTTITSGLINNSGSVTFGQSIGGSNGLIKSGNGTLSLNAASTYTGTTLISAGTLRVNNGSGSATGSGAVTVANNGTLGGTGIIKTSSNASVTVQSGGKLSAGTVVGGFGTTGTLTMDLGTGSLNISAIAPGALQFDLAEGQVSDTVSLSNASSVLNIGTSVLEFDDFDFALAPGAFNITQGDVFTLFDTGHSITGSLGTTLSGSVGYLSGTISISGGQDIIFTVDSVPEPSSASAVAMLALGRLLHRRRRQSRQGQG